MLKDEPAFDFWRDVVVVRDRLAACGPYSDGDYELTLQVDGEPRYIYLAPEQADILVSVLQRGRV